MVESTQARDSKLSSCCGGAGGGCGVAAAVAIFWGTAAMGVSENWEMR